MEICIDSNHVHICISQGSPMGHRSIQSKALFLNFYNSPWAFSEKCMFGKFSKQKNWRFPIDGSQHDSRTENFLVIVGNQRASWFKEGLHYLSRRILETHEKPRKAWMNFGFDTKTQLVKIFLSCMVVHDEDGSQKLKRREMYMLRTETKDVTPWGGCECVKNSKVNWSRTMCQSHMRSTGTFWSIGNKHYITLPSVSSPFSGAVGNN